MILLRQDWTGLGRMYGATRQERIRTWSGTARESVSSSDRARGYADDFSRARQSTDTENARMGMNWTASRALRPPVNGMGQLGIQIDSV